MSAEQMRTLQQRYTFLDDLSLLAEFLEEEPVIASVLLEAVQPLSTAFGDGQLLQVRVQHSDEETLLRVAVQLPADFVGDPEQELRSFDAMWWLNNCHRSGGALVFDYEILLLDKVGQASACPIERVETS
jgi:hypothetical protein